MKIYNIFLLSVCFFSFQAHAMDPIDEEKLYGGLNPWRSQGKVNPTFSKRQKRSLSLPGILPSQKNPSSPAPLHRVGEAAFWHSESEDEDILTLLLSTPKNTSLPHLRNKTAPPSIAPLRKNLPLPIKGSNSLLLGFFLHDISKSFQKMGQNNKENQDPDLSYLQKSFFNLVENKKKSNLNEIISHYNAWIKTLDEEKQEQNTPEMIWGFFWGPKVSDYLKIKRETLKSELLKHLTYSLLFLSDCCAEKKTKKGFLKMAAENYTILAKKSKLLNEVAEYSLKAARCFRKAAIKDQVVENYNLAGEKYLALAQGTKGIVGQKRRPQYYNQVLQCFHRTGQYGRAGEIFKSLAQNGRPQYYLEAAKRYLKAGEKERAKETFNELEKIVQDIDHKVSNHLKTLPLEEEVSDIEVEVADSLNEIKVLLKDKEIDIELEKKVKREQELDSAIAQAFNINREEATRELEFTLDELFLRYTKERDRIQITFLYMKLDKELAALLASSADTFENLPVHRHYFRKVGDYYWGMAWQNNISNTDSRKKFRDAIRYLYLAKEGRHWNVSKEWEEEVINQFIKRKGPKITFDIKEYR